MAHTKLIKENVAPSGAAYIGIKQGNSIAGRIAIAGSNLAQTRGTKLFSYALFSDVHLCAYDTAYYLNSENKFKKALDFCAAYNNNQGVEAAMVCGDLTVNMTPSEYQMYKTICNNYSFPFYACAGNHDFGYGYAYNSSGNGVTYNDAFWQTYTGQSGVNSYTSITKGGKKYYFIFLSIKKWRAADADDTSWESTTNGLYEESDIKKSDGSGWLQTTLANCQDGKCFVFVHAPIPDYAGDFGYSYDQRSVLLGKNLQYIKELSAQYKDNTVWFHGHTHTAWELQGIGHTNTDTANKLVLRGAISQTQANAGKGSNRDVNIYPCDGATKTTAWHVHVPSANSAAGYGGYPFANGGGSQFAIVDVYDNGIEIKGCGFRCNPSTGAITSEVKYIPIANYFLSF